MGQEFLHTPWLSEGFQKSSRLYFSLVCANYLGSKRAKVELRTACLAATRRGARAGSKAIARRSVRAPLRVAAKRIRVVEFSVVKSEPSLTDMPPPIREQAVGDLPAH